MILATFAEIAVPLLALVLFTIFFGFGQSL